MNPTSMTCKYQPIRIAQLNCRTSKNTVLNLLNTHCRDFDILLLQEPAWSFIGTGNGKEIYGPPSAIGWTPILPFGAPKDGVRPRTMTYVKTHAEMTLTLRTDLVEDPDVQVIDITQPNSPKITIINTYNDPRLKDHCILKRLPTFNIPFDHPTLITGDFNLHHPLWSHGPVGHDRITDEITDWLSRTGFSLLNEKGVITHPARHAGERDSVIDLSFANTQAMTMDTFKDWCVDPSLAHDSDHFAIRFVVDNHRTEIHNPTGIKYSLKETKPGDWINALESELERAQEVLNRLMTHDRLHPETLDEAAIAITRAMQAATSSTGKRYRPCARSKPWWDDELRDAARALAALRLEQARERQEQQTHDQRLADRIIKARNTFHRMCKKKKKQHAVETLESAKDQDIWSFQNWSRGTRNYPTPPIDRGAHIPPAVTHEEKCEALRTELYQPPPALPTPYIPDTETPIEDELPFENITEEEVYEAIHKTSTNTAPGYSQITYQCLQWAWRSQQGRKLLTSLMQKCLETGYHPKTWRKAVAVALRKPNKQDYGNPRSYRLITLLECMGKVLERIVARRLTYLASRYDLVPPNQFGGRASSSTSDALLTFISDIQSAWNHGYATSALTFDIKGYFDFVNHNRLLCELRRKKVPLPYIKWAASFLSDREAAVCIDGKVGKMERVENGIPQGSPISPILAAFYTAELLELFKNSPENTPITHHPMLPTQVQLVMYVDDGNLYVSSPALDTNVRLLEHAYQRVDKWLKSAGLSADLVKRELIHYCKPRTRTFSTSPSIYLCDNPEKALAPASMVKWLGVHFDRHLRFEQHVRMLATRGENAVAGLLMLANTVRGLSQIHMRRLYLACIAPKILYAAPVWWNGTRYQKAPLEKIQNRALRLICAAFRTTPIKALEIEASIPPIPHQINLLTRRSAIRFNKLPLSSPVIQRLGEEWHQNQSSHFPPPLPPNPSKPTSNNRRISQRRTQPNTNTTLHRLAKFTDPKHERIDPFLLPPWRRLSSSFDHRISCITASTTKKGTEEKRKMADDHIRNYRNLTTDESRIWVYTDGSMILKSGFRRVGAAAVAFHKGREVLNKMMGLGGHAEVFDGEMAALAMGITLATNYAREHSQITHIHIYTDNTAAIAACFDPKPTGGQAYAHSFYQHATRFLDDDQNNRISVEWCPGHCGVPGNERADRLARQATELARNSPIGTTRNNTIRRAKMAIVKTWTREWRTEPKHGWFATADRIPPSLKPTKHARRLANKRELFGRVVQTRTGHAYTGEFRRRFSFEPPHHCPCDETTLETREHILAHCPLHEEWRHELREISPDIVLSEILGTNRGIEALEKFLSHTQAFARPTHSHIPYTRNELQTVDPNVLDNG